jgi:hypothetical protein
MTRQMPYNWNHIMQFAAMVLLAMFVSVAQANDAGRIKVVKGAVEIERDGKVVPAIVGTIVKTSDTIVTGADGSVGITFYDDSLLSAGPNSTLSIDQFVFDSTTHQGAFDTTLKRGTLAAVSGKLVKERPESMRVKTPAAIMGVRGTEFLVRVAEARD